MNAPKLSFWMTAPDESRELSTLQAYIPTLGHPASNYDAYRTFAIAEVSHRPSSWCMTDTATAGALGRIVDGPIRSLNDLDLAESALRAILLHEHTDIIVPCAKTLHGGSFLSYQRFDQDERNDAAFEVFNICKAKDLLLASEFLEVSNGEIIKSSNSRSQLINLSIEDRSKAFSAVSRSSAELANALPIDVSASSYFGNEFYLEPVKNGEARFVDSLYRRIYKPWMEIAQSGPSLYLDVKLPPLIAIVLSRAANRSAIPTVVAELRDELTQSRKELARLNTMLEGSSSQAEIIDHTNFVNQSFDAIVPEALLTPFQLRHRRLASLYKLGGLFCKIYPIAADPLSATPQKFAELFQNNQSKLAKSNKIICRSVISKQFSSLLRTDSIREIVEHHFSHGELTQKKTSNPNSV